MCLITNSKDLFHKNLNIHCYKVLLGYKGIYVGPFYPEAKFKIGEEKRAKGKVRVEEVYPGEYKIEGGLIHAYTTILYAQELVDYIRTFEIEDLRSKGYNSVVIVASVIPKNTLYAENILGSEIAAKKIIPKEILIVEPFI